MHLYWAFFLPSISALCTLNNIFVKQALECVRHFNYLSGCGCGLDPLLATTMHFFVLQNKVHFSLKNRLTSIIIIIPHIGAIRRVETGNLWILRVMASYKFTCILWSSLRCHIPTTNKVELKKVIYNRRKTVLTTPFIIVRQAIVVVVLVVINAPYPSLSPKIRTKEVEL